MDSPTARVLQGDALTVLRTLPAESVQTCVTSPPYWGLRDYGTATWDGGADGCEHKGLVLRTGPPGTDKQASNHGAVSVRSVDCACGAQRSDSQIGLEPTPEAYVAALVEVFGEVRRVLRDDGTLWLNLGDSYNSRPGGPQGDTGDRADRAFTAEARAWRDGSGVPSLKPKDLVGIPWRVAFALQADGWWLRSDIIWAKPNPMPESITDRPTKAHEYMFLLAKSERYYYDHLAIAERAKTTWDSRDMIDPPGADTKDAAAVAQGLRTRGGNTHHPAGPRDTANKRSVWTVAVQPYADAHFATYPPDLIKPCIMAGSRPGDTVLDPFAGAGTTLYVAKELGRHGLGIELNPEYIALAEARTRQEVLPL